MKSQVLSVPTVIFVLAALEQVFRMAPLRCPRRFRCVAGHEWGAGVDGEDENHSADDCFC